MTHQQTRPQPVLPSPYPPQKRTPLWTWVALGVIVALAISALIWTWSPITPTGRVGGSSSTHTVVYQVEADTAYGSGRTGMVTIQTDDGGTSQGVVALPLASTFTGFHSGDFAYVSVQNQQHAGSVACRITVDGTVLSENTSTGGYTIATCQGSVPR